ncbi:MAG: hypothetical protein IKN47_05690 [Lachnospiraceae bacterium]|nr:hypothetical protein [Lachnospiraceae bacterium]
METKEKIIMAVTLTLAIIAMTFIVLSMLYDQTTTRYLTTGMSFLALANILNIRTMVKRRKDSSSQN